jgi:hypothetical protein
MWEGERAGVYGDQKTNKKTGHDQKVRYDARRGNDVPKKTSEKTVEISGKENVQVYMKTVLNVETKKHDMMLEEAMMAKLGGAQQQAGAASTIPV